MTRSDACVLCGHVGASPIVNRIARNNTPQTSVACSRCAFVQASPMPSEAELAEYYASGAYRRDFPPLRTEAEEEQLAREAAAFLETQMHLPDGHGYRILEIGCGEGRVAAALRRKFEGLDATEADPAMAAKAEARGVPCNRPAFSDAHEAGGAYSFLYAMQVLEHCSDPLATLRLWRSYLAPNGIIHVQVPTLERMYGGSSHFFQWPHVVNFTSRTLTAALLIAGFDVEEVIIQDHVLAATARLAPPMTYDEAASLLGPVDDVPALIARHEAARAARSDTERWLQGDGPRPSDDELRFTLKHMSALAGMAIDGVARLSMAAEAQVDAMDEKWSRNNWVQGFNAGAITTHESYQQATAHLANAPRVKAMGGR